MLASVKQGGAASLPRSTVVYSSSCCVLRLSSFPAQPALRVRPPGDAWLHEVKFDGDRCQLHKAGNEVVILSKHGRDFTNRFPGIRGAVLTLPCKSTIIDGEVVACRNDGTPDFRALHSGNYSQEILCVWCFDLMELNAIAPTFGPPSFSNIDTSPFMPATRRLCAHVTQLRALHSVS